MQNASSQQKKAIETLDGPLLVIAGPGSGKTFTLVERTVHIVKERRVDPDRILLSTFTEKASSELLSRVSQRLYEEQINFNVNEMYLGTIHSICSRIVDENLEFTRLKRNYTILDQFGQYYFIYQRIHSFRNLSGIDSILRSGNWWLNAVEIAGLMNKLTEELVDSQNLLESDDQKLQTLGVCLNLYRQYLREENALDFSNIQYETYQLLTTHDNVLKNLRKKISYLMIDEYQDTNTIQEKIFLLISGERHNICVVGDEDQSLYRFRGATVRNILEFQRNFDPGKCKLVVLNENYRSHPKIIDFYNRWMSEQQWEYEGKRFRFEKTISPREGVFANNQTVVKVAGTDSGSPWHEEILDFLQQLKRTGVIDNWNQIVFLFQSVKNPQVIALASFLEEKGVNVYSPRSNLIFDREEFKLLIGAFYYLFAWYETIRSKDSSYTNPIWAYLDDCFRLFVEKLRLNENAELLTWCKNKLKYHRSNFGTTNYGFSALFYELLQFPLFSEFLHENLVSGIIDSRPARNIALFSQLLVKFEYLHNIKVLSSRFIDKTIIDFFDKYLYFLKEGGLDEYEDDFDYAPSGCVSFMTIHQSKGLEFPVVIVGSLGASPRKNYTDLDELLQSGYYSRPPFEPIKETKYFDFRRQFFTAFSRAQDLLVLTCQEVLPGNGRRKVPSAQFVSLYESIPYWRDDSFDFKLLSLHSIKETSIKREYSYTTHILNYEACPRQYMFTKYLGFEPVRANPILFGNLVHETIEDIHKAVLRDETHLLDRDIIEKWFSSNYRSLSTKERVYLAPETQRVALEQVLKYFERKRGDWSDIREAEVDVSLVKEAYILKGKVDLIAGTGDTVQIIDFKAEKKPDLQDERDRIDQYRRQLEIYAHVVEQKTGLKVSGMLLYYTGESDGSPIISFRNDQSSINRTIDQVNNVVDNIESLKFSIETRPIKQCSNCDMRHYCDRRG